MTRPLALVIGPWRHRSLADDSTMDLVLSRLVRAGWAPVFYPRALGAVLSDHVYEERDAALACSQALVEALARAGADLFVVHPSGGRLATEGMEADLAAWRKACGPEPVLAPIESNGWALRLGHVMLDRHPSPAAELGCVADGAPDMFGSCGMHPDGCPDPEPAPAPHPDWSDPPPPDAPTAVIRAWRTVRELQEAEQTMGRVVRALVTEVARDAESLQRQVDELGTELGRVAGELGSRVEVVDSGVEATADRVEGLDSRLLGAEAKCDAALPRVANLEAEALQALGRLAALERRVERLDARLVGMASAAADFPVSACGASDAPPRSV